MPHQVVVIGGGVAGLSAAYRIVEAARHEAADVDVRVLEASDGPRDRPERFSRQRAGHAASGE